MCVCFFFWVFNDFCNLCRLWSASWIFGFDFVVYIRADTESNWDFLFWICLRLLLLFVWIELLVVMFCLNSIFEGLVCACSIIGCFWVILWWPFWLWELNLFESNLWFMGCSFCIIVLFLMPRKLMWSFVRSYSGWGGERNTLYKGVETSP